MTGGNVSFLVAVLGAISVLASWIVPADRDAPRTVWLRALGAYLLAGAAALLLVIGGAVGDVPLRPLMQ
ncbi:MAG: hypothetical protein ACJ8EC_19755 [Microvirga sp.]